MSASAARRGALWINGPFGVGKSAVGALVVERLPGWRLFDPESVGAMLRTQLSNEPFTDFQDWAAWRELVPSTAAAVARQTNSSLVVVQTVAAERYWQSLYRAMADDAFDVTHVVLWCDPDVLRRRIEADDVETGARQWRLGHIDTFIAARQWLDRAADYQIDTSDLTLDQVVASVLAAVA